MVKKSKNSPNKWQKCHYRIEKGGSIVAKRHPSTVAIMLLEFAAEQLRKTYQN